MTTFVIVHGAWGGGWEWAPVADRLRLRGHRVFVPTLAGMADRAHVCPDSGIGLGMHVQDVLSLIHHERLDRIMLCGASLGGMVVTAVADRVPELVRMLVYADALVPTDGQAAVDLLPAAFRADVEQGLAANGPGWRMPIPDNLRDTLVPPGELTDADRDAYLQRLCPHPALSFVEPIQLRGAVEQVQRAFVRCTAGGLENAVGEDPIAPIAARARAAGWLYRELRTRHDPQLFAPDETAALFDELASPQLIGK